MIKICSGWFSKINSIWILFKINISVKTWNRFYLIGGLSKSRSSSKWVRSNSCWHVVILSILRMSPESNWLCLSIITLWNSLPKLLIWTLLKSSPYAVLNNKLFILFIQADIFTVLISHNTSTNSVLLIILTWESWFCCSLPMPLFSG